MRLPSHIERKYTYRVTLTPTYSASHALVIGINSYKVAPRLSYAVSDATAMAAVLSEQFLFPQKNIHLLLEGAATRNAILDNFLSFACDGTELNDRLVVFFAGHGHTVRSSRGEVGYLVPWDGDSSKLSTLIRWDELTRNADLIEAKHILFLMDACYGGLAIMRALRPGSMRFLKDMLLRRSRQVLTAGKADEVVADLGGPLPNHSVFTGHLLEALGGKAADPSGVLTANGVVAYVYQNVSNDPESRQTPHFGYLAGDGDLVFSDILLAEPTKEKQDPLIPDEDILIAVPGVLTGDEGEKSMTVAGQAKDLLSEERLKIRLHDLVSQKTREVLSATGEDYFSVQGTWSPEEFLARLQKYESVTRELLEIQSLLGFWGEPFHHASFVLSPKRLAARLKNSGGLTVWLALRYYPLLLLLYCGGISAVAARKYDNLRELMHTNVPDPTNQNQEHPLIRCVAKQMSDLTDVFKTLPGHAQQYTPRSEYLLKVLQPLIDDLLYLGPEYETSFDRFEVLYALEHARLYAKEGVGRIWGPVGRFGWKRNAYSAVIVEAEHEGESWAPIKAGLFDGSIDTFKEIASKYGSGLDQLNWY